MHFMYRYYGPATREDSCSSALFRESEGEDERAPQTFSESFRPFVLLRLTSFS